MKVVGQISSLKEKEEIELIAKICIVGNRARILALRTHDTQTGQGKKSKHQMQLSIDTSNEYY